MRPHEQALGDWTLRAAAGFTGRANSARVGGDPGLEPDDAVAAVVEFYAEHGLPPMAQVIVDTPVAAGLRGAGLASGQARRRRTPSCRWPRSLRPGG